LRNICSGGLDNVPISITVPNPFGTGRAAAAWRAILFTLPPTPSPSFHVFFIGTPYGAATRMRTTPTTLP
jgi:hypothetical protein